MEAATLPREPIGSSRRSSAATASSVSVPTPSRDLSLRQGAFTHNIARLEQSAEEMSQDGSDIAEEIRKINRLSRQNSIQSDDHYHHATDPIPIPSRSAAWNDSRSRAGSGTNGILDLNNSARAGGYSPGGSITSPTGSLLSSSWSRKPSAASRLANMVGPSQDGMPLASPLTHTSSDDAPSRHASQSSFARRYDEIAGQIEDQLEGVPPSPPKHRVSLARPADHGDGRDQTDSAAATPPPRPASSDTFRQAQLVFRDFDGVHFAPETEEFVELDTHGNEIARVSARTSSGNASINPASLLRAPLARPITYAAPPPTDGMVYYPAPVPRMLNLPKRLSQLPSASVQARRKTQALSQLPPEVRNSAAWLSQTNLGEFQSTSDADSHPRTQLNERMSVADLNPPGQLNERMSVADLAALPPQLRASVFFDPNSIAHDVRVKSESAVATLDSILAASATAPVSAFTHHPYAGDVSKVVFAGESKARHSSANLLLHSSPAPEKANLERKARRSSFAGLLKRATSSDEMSRTLRKKGSRSSTLLDLSEGGVTLGKRSSQMSLGTELNPNDGQTLKSPRSELDLSRGLVGQAGDAEASEEQREASTSRPTTAIDAKNFTGGAQIEQDFMDEAAQEDLPDDDQDVEPTFAAPTTLLAELQVRKAQLKSRNRTAATAFPNGMHSSLLELDAVAAIDKKKRSHQRIALAWEDPSLKHVDARCDDEDDDVPLAVLYPGNNGLITRKLGDGRDWSRPLGLMVRREMEDNEPLSSRRSRLRGEPIQRAERVPATHNGTDAGLPTQFKAGGEDLEGVLDGETLTHRLRRQHTKDALDGAISDVAPLEGSRPQSSFADEVIAQLGGDPKSSEANHQSTNSTPAKSNAADAPVDPENETLGQRRARLQRERDAAGTRHVSDPADATARPRPPLQQRNSTADLLSTANPTREDGPEAGAKSAKNNFHQPARGTLLFASARAQEEQKRSIRASNQRSTSYHSLLDQRPPGNVDAVGPGAAAAARKTLASGGGGAPSFASPTANPYFTSPTANPYFVSPTANPYFASPTAAAVPPQMMPWQQQGLPMSPSVYGVLPGHAQHYAYAPSGAHMAMSMGGMGGMGMAMGGMNMGGMGTGVGGMGGMSMGMAMGTGYPVGIGGEPISPQQREAIDRWRLSVAQ